VLWRWGTEQRLLRRGSPGENRGEGQQPHWSFDAAVKPSAGVWKISMPFGSQLVQKLEFTSVTVAGGPDSALNSDFGIVSITSSDSEVPEAASVLLTGVGLVLLGGISRKWRSRPSDS
jgi:hypothetical protein